MNNFKSDIIDNLLIMVSIIAIIMACGTLKVLGDFYGGMIWFVISLVSIITEVILLTNNIENYSEQAES